MAGLFTLREICQKSAEGYRRRNIFHIPFLMTDLGYEPRLLRLSRLSRHTTYLTSATTTKILSKNKAIQGNIINTGEENYKFYVNQYNYRRISKTNLNPKIMQPVTYDVKINSLKIRDINNLMKKTFWRAVEE